MLGFYCSLLFVCFEGFGVVYAKLSFGYLHGI